MMNSSRSPESRRLAEFDRARRVSAYLLLLTGFSGLLMTAAVNLVSGLVFALAVVMSWPFQVRLTRLVQWIVVAVLLAAFVVDLIFWSSVVDATIHLLMVASLVKLFGEKTERDYQLLFAISFTFLLLASSFTISVLFLASLVAYIFFANLTFILNESQKSYLENRSVPFSINGYIGTATIISFLILLIAIPIFLAFPRSSLGLFPPDIGIAAPHLSGFSDKVNLGDLGPIMNDHRVFMRVRVEGETRAVSELKWRGIALDHYDGRSWRNTEKNVRYIFKNPETRSFELDRTRQAGEESLRQHINVVAYSNVIFGAGRIIQIFGIPGDAIQMDDQGALTYFSVRPGKNTDYIVDSGFMPRSRQLWSVDGEGSVPAELLSRYLQLPDLDPRIPELASRNTQSAGSALEKAAVLEQYLRSSYAYSLENVSAGEADPLAHFLFEEREGHCEYFATALTVMLRTLGIPSRIVNGFRSGELNEWNQYLTVRHSDAHSWTEAYFPGAGWIDFDPTPATGTGDVYGVWRYGRQLLDAVDLFWTEVVTFDRFKQIGFFVGLAGRIRDVVNAVKMSGARVSDFLSNLSWSAVLQSLNSLHLLLICLAGAVVAALAVFFRRIQLHLSSIWERLSTGKSEQTIATVLYQELTRVLGRRGYVRRTSETPLEFAERVLVASGSLLPREITEFYYRSRFGDVDVSTADVDWVRDRLQILKTQLKSHP